MKISFDLVVAMDLNSGIGKDGGLPWHLPADLKHFKELTCGTQLPSRKNVVVMGRKTWESLPAKFCPLPHRINIVLTKDQNFCLPKGVWKVDSFDALSQVLAKMPEQFERVFVIGGAQVFKDALRDPNCRKIYVTQILRIFECDIFFPPINAPWQKIYKSTEFYDQSLPYRFVEYIKVPNRGV